MFRNLVTVVITLTQFGISIIYLLLSAKNINSFIIYVAEVNIGQCLLILILAAGLLPLTFLKSPADFW